jgi:hypothetical protein
MAHAEPLWQSFARRTRSIMLLSIADVAIGFFSFAVVPRADTC